MSKPDYHFYFFGTPDKRKEVEEARANGKMQIVRAPQGGFEISIPGSRFGNVVLEADSNQIPCFYGFEDAAIGESQAPFQPGNIDLVLSFSIDVPLIGNSSMREFERFVGFVVGFEQACREYCSSKDLKLPAEIIPVGMSGILEYEFFRNVVPNATCIHLVLSIPQAIDGPPVINIQARVIADDDDSIQFGGYTGVSYAS